MVDRAEVLFVSRSSSRVPEIGAEMGNVSLCPVLT
jgi:hypothetical protein